MAHEIKKEGGENLKPLRILDAAHCNDIRQLPCVVCGAPPRNEAHHIKRGTKQRGLTLKSDDTWVIPLCPHHHRMVELLGPTFEPLWMGILAKELWDYSGPGRTKFGLDEFIENEWLRQDAVKRYHNRYGKALR